MDQNEIRETFEAFFEKYKKTEGDESSWSAVWFTMGPAGKFEINMTKCPQGTIFKVFLDNRKLGEIDGWENFFDRIHDVVKDYPDTYDQEDFFESMREFM